MLRTRRLQTKILLKKAESSEIKNVSNRMSFYNLQTLKYYTVFNGEFECVQCRFLRIIEYTFNIKYPSHDYYISVLCFLNHSALADSRHLTVFSLFKNPFPILSTSFPTRMNKYKSRDQELPL